MKKGIEAYGNFDCQGKWRLIITKKKGKLTLDEIRDACREYDEDYYLLVIIALGDNYDGYDFDAEGDSVQLYRMER